MKYVILLGDGMGDYPVEELGGRTPLQAAETPHIRRIAAAGRVQQIKTVPPGLPPGSDVCNLGLLGYDASKNYTGRAPIEAVGAGIQMNPDDVAFRCNLVTVNDGRMKDYSAGHITTDEATELISDLGRELETEGLTFHAGISYRHLVIWRDGPTDIRTQPPHDISDEPVEPHLPEGYRSEEVRMLMDRSRKVLNEHPVNKERIKAGKDPATQIWLWGQGRAMTLTPFSELHGLSGGIVTAVDLVRGIGVLAGLSTPVVPHATGFIDTNYEGKVQTSVELLKERDFVYVHVEAPDECGHMGDFELKTRAISDFDEKIVGPMWRALEESGEPYRLVIATDHRTPVSVRGHTPEPVPIAILEGPVGEVTEEADFDEFSSLGDNPVYSFDLISGVLKSDDRTSMGQIQA